MRFWRITMSPYKFTLASADAAGGPYDVQVESKGSKTIVLSIAAAILPGMMILYMLRDVINAQLAGEAFERVYDGVDFFPNPENN